ncbi:hypothetical protein CKO35_16730 [Ectothiorhodospira shaposhnikovii]|uniref:flagellar protein FliT n=1 Tax=Ectothiorhodospira shaposhnikovii TaxID=1054 RepID=UPI00190419AD|nr:flagellar protein FliT [Ectothiorhodospira shaposhnikovii]MBK1674900.1 hypothetical protein [Ectothiorhodospira shaposhnikovii]
MMGISSSDVHSGEAGLVAAELEALTEARLGWARASDWDRLLSSEERRLALAAELDAHSRRTDISGDEAERVVARLKRIRAMDDQMVPLMEAARDGLADELRQMRKGVSGTRLYEKVGHG